MSRLCAVLLLTACRPADIVLDDTGQVDSGADSGADSGDSSTDSGDSGADSGVSAGDAAVSDVTAWVDPDVVTLIHVAWTQDEPVDATWVEFRFETEEWTRSPRRGGEPGPHEELVIGVPSQSKVEWRVANAVGETTTWSGVGMTRTGVLPGELPPVELLAWDEALASPEGFVLGSIDQGISWYAGPFWAFLLDRKGRYVWYHEVPDSRLALYVQPTDDGRGVFFDGSTQYVWEDGVYPTVSRMTLDGTRLEETRLDDFGFAVDEWTDGRTLYEARGGREYQLRARNPDGSEDVLWSCTNWLESIGQSRESCAVNTIVWDRDRGTALWSMYQNNSVAEIDLESGGVVRYFGQLDGGWAFDPPESVVDYQHYVNWSPEGTLLASTHIVDEPRVQVCNEYAVDEASETLRLVWQYRSDDYYAQYAGECARTPNGNTLVGYGVAGAAVEVTPDQDVAWQIEWDASRGTHLIGHLTLIADVYALNGG